MPFTAYLFVESENGVIKGYSGEEDKTEDGKSLRDLSRIQEVFHEISIDSHPQDGTPQGNAKHKPLAITIEPDRSVAELYKAMSENHRFPCIKVYFFKSGSAPDAGSGKVDQNFHNWFSVTLSEARLVGMELKKANSAVREADIPLVDTLVKLTFTYKKIGWDDHDGLKSAEFDWNKKAG